MIEKGIKMIPPGIIPMIPYRRCMQRLHSLHSILRVPKSPQKIPKWPKSLPNPIPSPPLFDPINLLQRNMHIDWDLNLNGKLVFMTTLSAIKLHFGIFRTTSKTIPPIGKKTNSNNVKLTRSLKKADLSNMTLGPLFEGYFIWAFSHVIPAQEESSPPKNLLEKQVPKASF